MAFHGNTISVSVPTVELREEILRNKTGMLMRIARWPAYKGKHVGGGDRQRGDPGRPPDQKNSEGRVKYMTDKNPLLTEFLGTGSGGGIERTDLQET